MPDEVDDLILKMQHLEAEARASQVSRSLGDRAARLKTQAQKLAAASQDELTAAEKERDEGDAQQQRARTPGLNPLEAADLLIEGKRKFQEGKTRVTKAQAKLNFALGQMDEAERQEWDALQAEARAETHAQLAGSGDDSSRAPVISQPASPESPPKPAASDLSGSETVGPPDSGGGRSL